MPVSRIVIPCPWESARAAVSYRCSEKLNANFTLSALYCPRAQIALFFAARFRVVILLVSSLLRSVTASVIDEFHSQQQQTLSLLPLDLLESLSLAPADYSH